MKAARWRRWKTPVFLALVIFSNLAGDVCLRVGLRRAGVLIQSPRAYLQAVLSPWVGIGLACYFVWAIAQMALFSWADLTYIVPITSAGYALAAIAGWLLLGEFISAVRWLGICCIIFGVSLVSGTRARASESRKKESAA